MRKTDDSMNELAERAIEFFLDYLGAGDGGDFLSTALKSYRSAYIWDDYF